MPKGRSHFLRLKNSLVPVFLWIQVLLVMSTWIFYRQTVANVHDSEEIANRTGLKSCSHCDQTIAHATFH
jgi:hypothetical protein